jgi:predicted acetyltransferase
VELKKVHQDKGWRVEMLDNGRSVSRLWIVERRMRVGAQAARIGGIAGVGTDKEYRNRGLARKIMEGAVDLMRDEGYHGSFLFGIQDFYHRFGYATCMAAHRLHLDTRAAERAPAALKVRQASAQDQDAILRLYAAGNRGRTGSVVRTAATWTGFRMGSQFGVTALVRVVPDDRGRVRGYVVVDDTEQAVRIAEVGGDSPAVFGAILRDAAARAVRLRREEITFSLPIDHPFARYCRQFGCRTSQEYPRNAGPMGRIIDLGGFLRSVSRELASRWGQDEREVTLAIRTDLGECRLNWDGGQLAVECGADSQGSGPADHQATGRAGSSARGGPRTRAQLRLSQADLMGLLMGYHTPGELVDAGAARCTLSALPLVERLFPAQHAHMWWPDRF